MSSLQFQKHKSTFLIFILLLSHLSNPASSYSCDPPYLPATPTIVSTYSFDVCAKITLNTKLRLNGGGSVLCSTAQSISPLSSDSTVIADALCYKTTSNNLTPYKGPSASSCPAGSRLATLAEAQASLTAICSSIGWSDILSVWGGLVYGQGFNYDPSTGYYGGCYTTSSGSGYHVLCRRFQIEVTTIMSGERVCSSPCNTCSGSATFCLTCLSGYPLFYNNNCYATCPSKTFASSSSTCSGITSFILIVFDLCIDCLSPCENCSGSAMTCTSCEPGTPFFYNSYCYVACPPGTYRSGSTYTCLGKQSFI